MNNSIIFCEIFFETYKGPGNTFAPRISEYGIMIMGVVGSAKNGCVGPIASGNLLLSSALFGCTVFWATVFVPEVGGPELNER